ncbi:MAG: UDP-N-acetylmuramate dehydrogenase, partial [Alcanivoracaceae bacterium]|nr:UDP-N-acetylmuramate dehydrogenase [Alcanivoracaceae bacterium]
MTPRGHAALVNTLRLPAFAQWYAALDDIAQLPALLANPSVTNEPLTVLGEGSNVVLRSDLPGLVLRPQMRGMRIVE